MFNPINAYFVQNMFSTKSLEAQKEEIYSDSFYETAEESEEMSMPTWTRWTDTVAALTQRVQQTVEEGVGALAKTAFEKMVTLPDEDEPVQESKPISQRVGENVEMLVETASEKIASFSEDLATQGVVQKATTLAQGVEEKVGTLLATSADKVQDFSESTIGSKVFETGKAIVGENVGMLVGATFPEASIGYAVGKNIAKKYVGEGENTSSVVEGAAVLAGLTTVALSTSLKHLTGGDYGQALEYIVNASGTITGGMNGLEAVGQEVPQGYIPRTAAYLVTTGAVSSAVSKVASLPNLPGPVSATVSVGGAVLKTVSGTAAYYAPETAKMTAQVIQRKLDPNPEPPLLTKNAFDPGNIIQAVAKSTSGSSDNFGYLQAGKITESPLVASIIKMLITNTIDSHLATNGLVRAVNEFMTVLHDASIQKRMKEFKEDPTEIKKEALKKEISQVIAKKYGIVEKSLAYAMQIKAAQIVPHLVEELTEIMSKTEMDLLGSEMSDRQQTGNFLKVLLPELIPLIAVCVKREVGAAKDLNEEEIKTFYQNITTILLTPYNDYMIVRGVHKLATALVSNLDRFNFIPNMLAKKVGVTLRGPQIISLDDDELFTSLPKIPSTGVEKKEPPVSGWKRLGKKMKTLLADLPFFRVKQWVVDLGGTMTSLFSSKANKNVDPSEGKK